MARGRFISKGISRDELVNALSDDTCRLLFTWLITHLDCEGRMDGDAQTVKSTVFPRRKDLSVKKIEKCLQEMEKFSLILRYSVNGNQYLMMETFEKHQPGLRKDREAQSQIPEIPPDLLQSKSRFSPAQVKVQEQVQVKVQEQVKESSSSLLPTKNVSENADIILWVHKTFEENICKLTEQLTESLDEAINDHGSQWVASAIKEAAIQGQNRWSYVLGILRNWKRDGKTTNGATEADYQG